MMGCVRYKDDTEEIKDGDELWRRVPESQIIFDENLMCQRPSSQAFTDKDGGYDLSILLAKVLCSLGLGPEFALAGHEGFFLASITAGFARGCNPPQGVMQDRPDEQPEHAIVFGRKTRRVRRRLAKGAKWVVPPPR